MTTPRSGRVRLVALALAALTAVPLAAQSSGTTRGLIWKIEKGGRVGWLVGSLHLLTADAYPLPATMDQAFASADVLVEEADAAELQTPAAAMQVMAKAMNPPGVTLQSQVSKATYEAISARASRAGVPIERFQAFKPWMVAITLVGLEMQKGGFDPTLGLDRHFLERAPKAGKSVRTLETALEQIELLEKLSPQLQDALVSATLEGAETELTQVRRIAAAWKAGDPAPIEQLLVAEMKGTEAVYEALLLARNRRWVPQIENCVTTHRCFVVVGAAHLVGTDGLVALLKARGYTVEQQ